MMLNQSQVSMLEHEAAPQLDPAYAQFRDQTRFWIQRVAVPLIMVVGLFGNLVTVIIMTRRRMRSTTNMYLAALAFVDMLYLVLTFLLGLSHYPNMAGKRYYLYWQLRPFLMMLTDACSNTSVWLTVTFTIERFIAVKYPMKGKVWCTEARAKRLIVCAFLFGILFASPVPFEWKVIEKPVGFGSLKQLTQASDLREKNGNVSVERGAAQEAFQDPFSVAASHSGAKSTYSNVSNADGIDDAAFGVDIDAGPDDGSQKKVPMVTQEQRRPIEMIQTTNYEDQQQQQQQQQQAKDLVIKGEIHDIPYILSLDYTDFGRNETYKTIYYWSTAVIFYFIPLILLTFFNGFLILSVHRSLRERNRMTIGQQLTLSSASKQGQQQIHSARIKMWQGQKAGGSKPTPIINSLDLGGASYSKQANAHDTNSIKSKTRSMINRGGQLVVAKQFGSQANSVIATRRLLTPKISMGSKQNCIIENDGDGAEVANVKREIDSSMESGKVFQDDSLLGSGAEKVSAGGGSDSSNQDTARTRHILGDENSIRGHPGRRVESNCDKTIRDGGDLNDGTSMVKINCDTMKSSTGGVGVQLVARGTIANGTSMSASMNERGNLKSAIMAPILKSQQNDATAAGTPLPTPSPSMSDPMFQANQSNGSGSSSSSSMRSFSGLDQLARLDVSIDNALATTCRRASRDLQEKKMIPRTSFECRLRQLTSRAVANSSTLSNNEHRKRVYTARTTSTSNNGKLNKIKSTPGSSPNIKRTGSCHDSGSCTMIQPGASMVPISSQERRITIMLIAVVILFICCQIPSAAMLLYTSVREPIPNTNEHALVLAFGNIFNFLMAINAAGNFILYSFLSKKYRRTFVILFCSCLKKASDISSSSNNYSDSSKARHQSSRASYFSSSQVLPVNVLERLERR